LKITDNKTTHGHQFLIELIFTTSDKMSSTIAIYSQLLLILEICQICCSLLVWFFFITKQAPLVYKKAQDRISEMDGDNVTNETNVGFGKELVTNAQKVSKRKKIFTMIRNFTIYTTYLLFDPLILYYLFYVTFAILGMFNPVFIAILLLDVFFR